MHQKISNKTFPPALARYCLLCLPVYRCSDVALKRLGSILLSELSPPEISFPFLYILPQRDLFFVNIFLRFCNSGVIYPFYEANIYFKIILSASSSGNLSYQWALVCIHIYKYCLNWALLSANGQSSFRLYKSD